MTGFHLFQTLQRMIKTIMTQWKKDLTEVVTWVTLNFKYLTNTLNGIY